MFAGVNMRKAKYTSSNKNINSIIIIIIFKRHLVMEFKKGSVILNTAVASRRSFLLKTRLKRLQNSHFFFSKQSLLENEITKFYWHQRNSRHLNLLKIIVLLFGICLKFYLASFARRKQTYIHFEF